MDTKIDGARLARSGLPREPDPPGGWAPLGVLADAAERVAEHGAVAIARGFDRNSRRRSKALRGLLGSRAVAAIEVTSAPGSERLLAGTEIDGVVNLLPATSWLPYRLAARLRVPMFTPSSANDDPAAEIQRDVIGMTGENETRDVALSHVAVRPEDPTASSLLITRDGEPLSLPGGWVALELEQRRLRVRVGSPDFAEQSFEAPGVRVETLDGPHRLVRDELPIAEFEGAVEFAADPGGLVVRPV